MLFELGREEGNRTIGRRAEASLSIPWDGEVSGLHAELQCLGGEWTIVDDGLSRNGTFLNGERVLGRQRLQHGDLIRVGRTMLSYDIGETSSADATVIAGEGPALPRLSETQQRVLIALCRPLRDGGHLRHPREQPADRRRAAPEPGHGEDEPAQRCSRGFELSELPQNRKRARLAELALEFGLVSRRELEQ